MWAKSAMAIRCKCVAENLNGSQAALFPARISGVRIRRCHFVCSMERRVGLRRLVGCGNSSNEQLFRFSGRGITLVSRLLDPSICLRQLPLTYTVVNAVGDSLESPTQHGDVGQHGYPVDHFRE